MASSHCIQNPPTLNSSCGQGSVQQLGGLNTYINGSQDAKSAIIFVSDVFGFEAPKLRALADETAAAGFLALVPDFFHGDPMVIQTPPRSMDEWKITHAPAKSFKDAISLIAALRSKGVTGIGGVGFCWGAQLVVALAKSEDIQAAVLLHPSLITADDIKDVKSPMCILGAELDPVSPPRLLQQFEEVLCANKVDCHVKVFPGVNHGWSVRYNDDDEPVVKCAKDAHQDMLSWFAKYLK